MRRALTVHRWMSASNDVDLFVVYDANNDGAVHERPRSSPRRPAAPGRRVIELVRPPTATTRSGHGLAVAGTPDVTLGIDIVQGNDLTCPVSPAGAIPAGTPVAIHVDFSKAMVAGQTYLGELLLGPPAAPTALQVPVEIERT